MGKRQVNELVFVSFGKALTFMTCAEIVKCNDRLYGPLSDAGLLNKQESMSNPKG